MIRRAHVAVALAAALGAGGCGAWQEPPVDGAGAPRDRPDDGDLAVLVPARVATVIEADVAALRASAWTRAAIGAGGDEDAAGDADPAHARDRARARAGKVSALGYDDVADVDRVVYAVPPAGAAVPTLVIATGRIDAGRVEAAFRMRHPDSTSARWRGVEIVARGDGAMAMLTGRTFVAGTPEAVRAVIDRAFGAGAGAFDPAAAHGLVRRALLPPLGRAAPAVLVTVAIDAAMRARAGDAFPLPRQLSHVGLRLDLGQTLDVEALGLLDDRGAAEALARRLSALLRNRQARAALGALGLGPLLGAARVTAEGARVHLVTSVMADDRPALAEALRALVAALRGS